MKDFHQGRCHGIGDEITWCDKMDANEIDAKCLTRPAL